MNKNIEKEFKILLNKEQFEKLYAYYHCPKSIKQVNIYYDTEDSQIRNSKGAMRIRTKNNKHIFTLKMFQNNELLEYECEVKENSLDALNEEPILSLLSSYHIKGTFKTIATLETNRAVVDSEYAELCFDVNKYNNTIDYEIEYEFKKEHDGLSRFNEILSLIDMTYQTNCLSKIERALSL